MNVQSTDIDEAIVHLRAAIRADVAACIPITTLPGPESRRATYRIDTTDGRVLKLRCVESPQDAERVCGLARRLESTGLIMPLARHDNTLLEPWIEGDPIAGASVTPDVLASCGQLLGAMHVAALEAADDTRVVRDKAARLKTVLGQLTALSLLTLADAERIAATALAHAPRSAAVGIIHGDFCAENLVRTADGAIRSIDNEGLRVDALDYDLARTAYRWPLPDADMARFLGGYATKRDPAPYFAARVFWDACCYADALLFRATAGTNGVDRPRRLLTALIDAGPALGSAPRRSAPQTAAAATLDLAIPGRAVRVECDDPADAAWLGANLAPPFFVDAPGAVDATIRVAREFSRYVTLDERSPDQDDALVPCFGLDTAVVNHPAWRDKDGTLWVRDRDFRVFYGIRRDPPEVRVVYGRTSRWRRVALLRVVREILAGASVTGAGLLLHAAGLAVGDRAIAIAGPKFAGKTTLLIHLLGAPGTAYIANDRLLVHADDHGMTVRGVPTIVRVRAGTAERFPHILARGRRAPASFGPAEGVLTAGEPAIDRDGNITLSPAQFAEVLGAPRASGGRLAAIVLPRQVAGLRGAKVRRLGAKAAERALKDCRAADHGPSGATVFANLTPATASDGQADPTEALARGCAVIALDMGEDIYRTMTPADLLAMVLDRATAAGKARRASHVEPAIVAPHGSDPARDAARAAGRPIACVPPDAVASARLAARLDASGTEAMIVVPGASTSERKYQDATFVPTGWILSTPAAARILPALAGPDAWSVAGLFTAARHHLPGLRWRSAPAGGQPAPAGEGRPALDRHARVVAIVPHYRCEPYLAEALDSLLAQTRPPQAIAVIDDGSGQPPHDICARYPGVSLYAAAANVGPYGLVQALLDATDFDAILFQDADDWSMADRLALLLAEAERTGAELVGTQELRMSEDGAVFRPALYPLDVNAACSDVPHHTLLHPTSLVATGLIRRLGGLANALRYSGDTEFLYRAVFAARVVNIPEFAYVRRDRAGSLTLSAATGLQSPARQALLARLSAVAQERAACRARGEAVDLTPLETAPTVTLNRICGPELRARPTEQTAASAPAGRASVLHRAMP